MPNPAIPEISATARLLHARLAKATVGEVIPYPELSAIAKDDVRQKRGPLATARRMAFRQENFVFGTIVGVGLKRLDDVGITGEVGRYFQRTHRDAIRGLRTAEKVTDVAGLPDEPRTRLLATASCLGAIAHASREMMVKRVAVNVEKTQKRLPLDETLKAFA